MPLEPQRSSTRTAEHHEGTTLHSCCVWHRAPCQPSRHHICQAQATRHFRQQRNGQAGTRLKARAHGDPWDVNEKRGKRRGALRQAVAEAARRQDGRSRAPSRRDSSSRGKTSALEPGLLCQSGRCACAGVSRAFRCCMHVSELAGPTQTAWLGPQLPGANITHTTSICNPGSSLSMISQV